MTSERTDLFDDVIDPTEGRPPGLAETVETVEGLTDVVESGGRVPDLGISQERGEQVAAAAAEELAGSNPGNPGTEEMDVEITRREQELEELRAQRAGARADDPYFWLVESEVQDGIVVDAGVARSTPCTVIDLGDDSELVFSKGVIGALDEEQKALFCLRREVQRPSDAQRRRIEAFREASRRCAETDQQSIVDRIGCIKRELERAGVAIADET
jgi:hypothetical protein